MKCPKCGREMTCIAHGWVGCSLCDRPYEWHCRRCANCGHEEKVKE